MVVLKVVFLAQLGACQKRRLLVSTQERLNEECQAWGPPGSPDAAVVQDPLAWNSADSSCISLSSAPSSTLTLHQQGATPLGGEERHSRQGPALQFWQGSNTDASARIPLS